MTSFYESILPLVLVGAGMGILFLGHQDSIMSSVPSYRRGIAAGVSTMLVMTGSAFSIGLVFLVFVNYMPLNEDQRIFTGSFATMNTTTIVISKFMDSLHFIFFISAILMVISIVRSFGTMDL